MADVYEIVTERILAELEKGIIPWRKPWIGAGGAVSYASGRPYSFVNQMMLGEAGEYITYKQAAAVGGQVRKGSKGRAVVYYKAIERPALDENGMPKVDKEGKPIIKRIPYLQYFTVFHLRDVDGVEPKWTKPGEVRTVPPIEAAEAVFADYLAREGIVIEHGENNEACYSPTFDRIRMPNRDQFISSEEYYSTAYHEGIHSTGHSKRLGRFADGAGGGMFGSESYSKEELVAEIGASASMSRMGIETDATMRNNVAYVQSWLKALKNDKKMVVEAAGKAEKAVKWMFGEKAESGEMAA